MLADHGIKIYKDDEFEVWCGCDGDNIINAHIIGIGPTKNAAMARAVAELESMVAALQERPESFEVEDVTGKL